MVAGVGGKIRSVGAEGRARNCEAMVAEKSSMAPRSSAALKQAGGGCPLPSTVRTGNALKVRFSDTLGQEPEIELGLV